MPRSVRATVLGSRQQMCLNPAVSKLPAAAGNAVCHSYVKMKKCNWWVGVRAAAAGCARRPLGRPSPQVLLGLLCGGEQAAAAPLH